MQVVEDGKDGVSDHRRFKRPIIEGRRNSHARPTSSRRMICERGWILSETCRAVGAGCPDKRRFHCPSASLRREPTRTGRDPLYAGCLRRSNRDDACYQGLTATPDARSASQART